MEEYWRRHPLTTPVDEDAAPLSPTPMPDNSIMSDFDHHRQALLVEKLATGGDGWRSEVHKYSKMLEEDVSPKTDVVRWWQVHR